MPYDVVVFDLDGTLADTAGDIAASLSRALAGQGRQGVAAERVKAALGRGARRLVEALTPAPHEPVLEAFLADYAAHLVVGSALYPGVAETLAAIPARRVLLTNKPEAMARVILAKLGIAGHFAAAYGGDSFPVRKPDPGALRAAAGAADPGRVLMVGDTRIDVETARAAGARSCAVTYGYHTPGDLDGADHRIDRFADLLALLRG